MVSVVRRTSLLAAVSLALVIAPLAVTHAQSSVDLLGYHATVPSTWVSRKAASSMRLAEYVVPPGNGSTDSAEIVVYFFGKGQGSNVDANIARWRAQFSTPDG